MNVRRATESDLGELCRLRLAFLAEHRGLKPSSFSNRFTDETKAFFERRTREGTMRSWLADADGRNVGTVSVLVMEMAPRPEWPRCLEGYVVNMYVEPSFRRRGIGRQLAAALLEGADQMGLRKLLLHTTSDGEDLYEQVGFEFPDNFMELRLDV